MSAPLRASVSPPLPGRCVAKGSLAAPHPPPPTLKTPDSTKEGNWEQLPPEQAWEPWGGVFPSRRTPPRGLCQIVSPNPAFLLGRAAFSGAQERWPVQPPCLQCSDAAGNLIWADQGGPPHWAQAVSILISRRLTTAGPPASLSPAARPPAHGGPSLLQVRTPGTAAEMHQGLGGPSRAGEGRERERGRAAFLQADSRHAPQASGLSGPLPPAVYLNLLMG